MDFWYQLSNWYSNPRTLDMIVDQLVKGGDIEGHDFVMLYDETKWGYAVFTIGKRLVRSEYLKLRYEHASKYRKWGYYPQEDKSWLDVEDAVKEARVGG